MKLSICSAFLMCALVACTSNNKSGENATVHIKGQLIDMGSNTVRMSYNGAASALGDSRDIELQLDSAGYFDTIVSIKEPTYFNISRNTLYLTPGDDLTVKITTSNDEAEFSGEGAVVNNYMKYRLFPKGGSYLQAGANIKKDFITTKAVIDSLAALRIAELNALQNVSDDFKKLEKARIQADIINSYICYASYSGLFRGLKTEEEFNNKFKEFSQTIAPEVNPLYKQIAAEEFLDVAVVRDVMSYSADSTLTAWFEGITIPQRTKELISCETEVGKLRGEASKEVIDEVSAFTKTIKNKDFEAELIYKIKQVSKLLPGQPAPDIEIEDVKGNKQKLSDFKGKVIYIDLWATWCGPCIQESPAFEALSKKYAGKDIVFLPISTDTDTPKWLNYLAEHHKDLTQYHSTDKALKAEWGIFYIPRFVLIDKDFTIINAYAPRPSSSEEIVPVIDKALNK